PSASDRPTESTTDSGVRRRSPRTARPAQLFLHRSAESTSSSLLNNSDPDSWPSSPHRSRPRANPQQQTGKGSSCREDQEVRPDAEAGGQQQASGLWSNHSAYPTDAQRPTQRCAPLTGRVVVRNGSDDQALRSVRTNSGQHQE